MPPEDRFAGLQPPARSLNALYWELAGAAKSRLVLLSPYLDVTGLGSLLEQWITQRPDLEIEIVHRKEAVDPEAKQLKALMRKYAKETDGRVRFYTFPARNPQTGRLVDRTSFHCKLADPGNGQVVEFSSNMTSYAQAQNVEVAYVFEPGQADDLRRLCTRIRSLAVPDPWAQTGP